MIPALFSFRGGRICTLPVEKEKVTLIHYIQAVTILWFHFFIRKVSRLKNRLHIEFLVLLLLKQQLVYNAKNGLYIDIFTGYGQTKTSGVFFLTSLFGAGEGT